MAIGDIFRVRAYTYDVGLTQVGINTTFWRIKAELGTGATIQQIALALETNVSDEYTTYLPTVARWAGLTVQLQGGSPLLREVVSKTFAGPGVNGASVLPGQTAAVINFKTAFAGPRYRGRIYLPFLPAAAVDPSGEMNAVQRLLFQSVADAYMATVTAGAAGNTADLELVLRSENQPPTVPPTYQYFLINEATATGKFGTQRRRGDYGQFNTSPL